jgi:hypothetical protein
MEEKNKDREKSYLVKVREDGEKFYKEYEFYTYEMAFQLWEDLDTIGKPAELYRIERQDGKKGLHQVLLEGPTRKENKK